MTNRFFEVQQFICRQDNIALLLHNKKTNIMIAIDSPDGEAVYQAAQAAQAKLEAVLITHHHSDHISGLAMLKAKAGARIYGPAAEAAQIGRLDVPLAGDTPFSLGGFKFEALATPGHTKAEISYYLPQQKLVFTGDTLFSLGCGRLFEGTAAMMFASLQKLAALPADTQIYCGHEYSAANARFALTVEPGNQALQKRAAEIAALRRDGQITLPQTMAQELAANPFLRAESAEIRKNLDMETAGNEAVFAKLRQMKDAF